MLYDLIIIGAGPAGMTAGIYAARKNLSALLLTKDFSGQIFHSAAIENYPGFEKISGVELTLGIKKHLLNCVEKSEKFSVKENYMVEELRQTEKGLIIVKANGEEFSSKTIIIAAGAKPKNLNIPGADKFYGKGISFCETCDAPIFKGKDVAVVGCGNSGLQSVLEVSNYARKVYLLNERDDFLGDDYLVRRVESLENVEIVKNIEIKEVSGNVFVEKIIYFDKETKQEKELQVLGIFVKIGQVPNSGFVKGFLDMTEDQEIVIDKKTCETSVKNVFAAGDITDIRFKQYIIAAGEGAKAALSAYNSIKN
jgi:alkyl hydroperoxide reductase subunit F